MADERSNSEPTELIYLPEGSWYPALLAAGVAGVIASLFTWWPYGVVGALVALVALFGWIRDSRQGFAKLPRQQRTTTAVLPAVPLRRRGR
jgi:hypothetical protein